LIIFPEGTRSPDGYVREFKRGVSVFSERTNTPVLFLYIEGNAELFPKGAWIPKPGFLTIHVGPVLPPEDIQNINERYKEWALTINPNAYPPEYSTTEDSSPEVSSQSEEPGLSDDE
jgi:1-acyl-sn-glycerol-3-phosphate acyltransferase